MNIQKIRIEGFKSLYEPVVIDFSDIHGFWKISGDVGAGKTTIGEAIIFGLFGSVSGKNNSDLISWGRKKGLVEVWCTSKQHNLYIKREMKTYGQSPIYVEVDGEEMIFVNKKDAQSQLEQDYYDISRVTLELLCIISFNNFKSLATLNTNDTRKFLDQVLGFYILTNYSEYCKELKNNNFTKISSISSQINQLLSQIKRLEELKQKDNIKTDENEVKNTIKIYETYYNDTKTELNTYLKEKNNLKKVLETSLANTLALGQNKNKEINLVKKGKCPTCGATIDQSHLQDIIDEREELLKQYNQIKTQIKTVNDEINEHVNDIETNYLNKYQNVITQQKNLLIRIEEQLKWTNVNNDEIQKISNEIDLLQKELLEYQQNDAQWVQLYDILSVQTRMKILQSFIPSLNKNILKYSQRLHLPYIVSFDQSFKCKITLCGIDKEIHISSLSTGQLKVVDMVIILGVLGTVIGSNGINVLFLDELFSNLDSSLRNEMCQILKESIKEDITIFIISHTDLDNKYFDGNIHMKLEIKDGFEKHSKYKIEKFKYTE